MVPDEPQSTTGFSVEAINTSATARTAAVRKIREAVMTANAAIACGGIS